MTDIQIINNQQVRFHKKLYHDSELVLAHCFNFDVNIENGTITATIIYTAKRSMYEFIRVAFRNFSESYDETARREEFYRQMDSIYENVANDVKSEIFTKLPYAPKLYAHQVEGIQFAYFNRCSFLAYGMRLGKSIISASLSRLHNIRRTLIICPAVAKMGWFRDLTSPLWGFNELYFSVLDAAKSKSFVAFQERFIIVNYDSLNKFTPHILSSPIGHIIIDECFVYDTLIQTDIGLLKIGDIVENKIKCNALSFDSLNNEYIYKPISNWIKNPIGNKKLIKVKVDGTEFTCTEDHKIWTRNGFKRAKSLSNDDILCRMLDGKVDEKKGERYRKILQQKVFHCKQKQKPGIQKEVIGRPGESSSENTLNMRNMQEGLFCNKIGKLKKILLEVLFCKMENERPDNETKQKANRQRSHLFKNENISQIKSRFCEKVFSKDEGKKPNDELRNKGKNGQVFKGENFSIKRRKRDDNDSTKENSRHNRMAYGTPNNFKKCASFIPKFAEVLQGGFSHTRTQNCNRDRWENAPVKKVEIFGQKENRSFKFTWLDSIEILERGGGFGHEGVCSQNYVYDLTVDDTHCYFANSVLVSNCHRLKNRNSDRFKHVKKIVDSNPTAKITMLSGTAIPNRFNDLFAYFNLTKHHLGESYKKFTDEFTIKTNSRGGEKVTGAKNIADLKLKMSNFMLVKTMEECFDMPEDVVSRYTFQMDDYRPEYDKIIKEMTEAKEMSALNGHIHSLNIITCKSKIPGIIEALEEIIEETGKVVVFGTYKEPLQMLEDYFNERCVKVVGGVSSYDRDAYKQRFHSDASVQVFLANYEAGGEALDLSVANDVFIINFPLTPRELNQAKARIKHPEKMNRHSRIHFTFCENSIDEHIYDNIIINKEEDINILLHDGKEVVYRENVTETLIKSILGKNDIKFIHGRQKSDSKVNGEESSNDNNGEQGSAPGCEQGEDSVLRAEGGLPEQRGAVCGDQKTKLFCEAVKLDENGVSAKSNAGGVHVDTNAILPVSFGNTPRNGSRNYKDFSGSNTRVSVHKENEGLQVSVELFKRGVVDNILDNVSSDDNPVVHDTKANPDNLHGELKTTFTSIPSYYLMCFSEGDVCIFIVNEGQFNKEGDVNLNMCDCIFSHTDINEVIKRGRHEQLMRKASFDDKYTPNDTSLMNFPFFESRGVIPVINAMFEESGTFPDASKEMLERGHDVVKHENQATISTGKTPLTPPKFL